MRFALRSFASFAALAIRPTTLALLALVALVALVALAAPLTLGCTPAVQEHVVLKPEGEAVEFAMDTPSKDSYEVVGTVKATAAGKTVEEATTSAQNDIRNKAAGLGATLVKTDKTDLEKDTMREKRIVTLTARAFRAKN